ncbi:hypothetical protein KNE206_31000 [Kitasatospora sp. NE20-6]|uniref:hypothetical protein n=1 Tax=Kitasatospora sp. NE20-6 TaxID=2859066 RepID=UPI0034DCA8C0
MNPHPNTDPAPGPGPEGPLLTRHITAGPGGVMTIEVGVITGDLTLRTTRHGSQVALEVQYDDAEEWYTVQDSPLDAPAGTGLHTVHQAMTDAIEAGNAATAPH